MQVKDTAETLHMAERMSFIGSSSNLHELAADDEGMIATIIRQEVRTVSS